VGLSSVDDVNSYLVGDVGHSVQQTNVYDR